MLDATPEQKEMLAAKLEGMTVLWTTRQEETESINVQQVPETLIPEVWAERNGVKIIDPGGWTADGKSFYEPITEDEWNRRVIVSTLTTRSAN